MALKSDNGNLLFQRLIMLLRLNMVLVQKNAYMRSIMMQLLNMMHQKQHNLPSWQMFSKSTAVFNEEVGETSFSILSRLVLGDTTKCSFEHIDLMYGLIHTYRANNADMTGDQRRKTRPNKRYSLDKKQETAEAIPAHHPLNQGQHLQELPWKDSEEQCCVRWSTRGIHRGLKPCQRGNGLPKSRSKHKLMS